MRKDGGRVRKVSGANGWRCAKTAAALKKKSHVNMQNWYSRRAALKAKQDFKHLNPEQVRKNRKLKRCAA